VTTDTRLSALLRSHAVAPCEESALALLRERVRLNAPGARGTCATCGGRAEYSRLAFDGVGFDYLPCPGCTTHPGEVATLACGVADCVKGRVPCDREGCYDNQTGCKGMGDMPCPRCAGTGIARWPERARLLAYCGHPGAREVLGDRCDCARDGLGVHGWEHHDKHWLSDFAKGLASFGRVTAVRAAYAAGVEVHERDLACACMGDVETCAALDALQAALAWARCPCERHREALDVCHRAGLPRWATAGLIPYPWADTGPGELLAGILTSAHQALGGTPEAAQQIRDAIASHMKEWL